MKKLLILLLGLTLSSCSFYTSGYDDGYSDGYWDGSDDYKAMVERAVEFGFDMEAYFPSGYYISFVKLADDDESFAVYVDNYGMIRAIRYDDYNPYLSWGDNWLGHDNYLYGLTDNGNGTYSCNPGSCYEYAAINPNPYFYGMVFEEAEPSEKDLEKLAAFQEALQIETMSEKLSAEFGLSEERSHEVSSLILYFNKKARSAEDYDVFFEKLIGMKANEAMEKMRAYLDERDEASFEDLIDRASQVNDLAPEHVRQLVEEILL